MEVQTRSEETGIILHTTTEAALDHAKKDQTVWKISWTNGDGHRIRLVKEGDKWVLRDIIEEIEEMLARH